VGAKGYVVSTLAIQRHACQGAQSKGLNPPACGLRSAASHFRVSTTASAKRGAHVNISAGGNSDADQNAVAAQAHVLKGQRHDFCVSVALSDRLAEICSEILRRQLL
jgi:hypothetical protein